MQENANEKITVRERLTIVLVIFLVKMIKPWQYDHQFDKFWNEIKESIK